MKLSAQQLKRLVERVQVPGALCAAGALIATAGCAAAPSHQAQDAFDGSRSASPYSNGWTADSCTKVAQAAMAGSGSTAQEILDWSKFVRTGCETVTSKEATSEDLTVQGCRDAIRSAHGFPKELPEGGTPQTDALCSNLLQLGANPAEVTLKKLG